MARGGQNIETNNAGRWNEADFYHGSLNAHSAHTSLSGSVKDRRPPLFDVEVWSLEFTYPS